MQRREPDPAATRGAQADGASPGRSLGTVGAYQIVRELARGGMGVVYEARHPQLARGVALKLLQGGALASPKARERFAVEARAAARLRHPNIVGIHDVGEDRGVPYIAMDLIAGESLAQRLARGGPLEPREAARLTHQLALALSYAHSHMILHRDLKPANVLLQTGSDGVVQPLITDFGLAKEVDGSSDQRKLTVTGQLLGTPAYMPPEQARGDLDQLDRRSDVYSLGATLYEMLTGEAPFEGDRLVEVVGAVLAREPVRPGRLVPALDGDLETICLKCLEKEPAARYTSASALADDLQAHLEDRPISARPPSLVGRLGKWRRRNQRLSLAIVGVTAAALAGIGIVATLFVQETRRSAKVARQAEQATRQALAETEAQRDALAAARAGEQAETQRANDEREEAERQRLRAEQQLSEAQRLLGYALEQKGLRCLEQRQWSQAAAFLAAAALKEDLPRRNEGAAQALARLWTSRDLPFEGEAYYGVWSADGARFAAPSRAGKSTQGVRPGPNAVLYDVAKGQQVGVLQGHQSAVGWLAFSPNGQRLATASVYDLNDSNHLRRGDRIKRRYDQRVQVWSADGAPLATLTGHEQPLANGAWSPDSRQLATAAADGTVRLWDSASGRELRRLEAASTAVRVVSWSPSGEHLVTAAELGARKGRQLTVWDVARGERVGEIPISSSLFAGLAQPTAEWSPDGDRLATCWGDGDVRLWKVGPSSLEALNESGGSSGGGVPTSALGQFASWAADGQSVAGTSRTGVVVWDREGKPKQVLRGVAEIQALSWSPDGRRLLTVSQEGAAQVWTRNGEVVGELREPDSKALAVVWAPSGRLLAMIFERKRVFGARQVKVFDRKLQPVVQLAWQQPPEHLRWVGEELAVVAKWAVRLWRPPDGEAPATLSGTPAERVAQVKARTGLGVEGLELIDADGRPVGEGLDTPPQVPELDGPADEIPDELREQMREAFEGFSEGEGGPPPEIKDMMRRMLEGR